MAYYEILIFSTIVAVSMFYCGYITGKSVGNVNGFKEGFTDARKAFYDDFREEEKRAEQAELENIRKVNETPPGITPEILMAFGVESTAYLPKHIREYYKITENKSLDDLIREEDENDRN